MADEPTMSARSAFFQSLVNGETENLPDQESNTVRIFLSSTFTDMKEERNKLMQEVFPELRRYCQQRQLEFEVVDMRWGVRDSATADHLTSFLCLNEIDRCKRMSQGPYFVGFLGNKYGYRPLKSTIQSRIFKKLMTIISQNDRITQDDINLLKMWYAEDANAIPPVYALRPITALLPHFHNKSEPDKEGQARRTWWEMYTKMRNVFDEFARSSAAREVYSEQEIHSFVMSVTEEEIRHALKDNTNIQDTCLFFIRDFQNLVPSRENRGLVADYADVEMIKDGGDVQFNRFPQDKLSTLKAKYIPSVVPSDSVMKYNIPWTEKGLNPTDCKEHIEYLNDMCKVFEKRMKDMIEKSLQDRKMFTRDLLQINMYKELLHHSSFCKIKYSTFQGREDLMGSIQACLTANLGRPLVIHGVSGSGKTSIMAMVAKHSKEFFGRNCVTVLRFLGTSVQTSSIHMTLQSICRQICIAYGVEQPADDHLDDFSETVQTFNNLIRTVPSKERSLLLLLDSIDQLASNNNAHMMNWLPKHLHENTHIVVSMLEEEHQCLKNIKVALKDNRCYIKMDPLEKDNGLAIMKSLLKSRDRTLTREQVDIVTDAFIKCPQPLFLKLLFEEFVSWPSFKKIEEINLPGNISEAILSLFKDLEDRHGRLFVAHALGYLTAGKSGLTEAEIEDVLSCDDKVLNDVYQYWDPPDEDIVRIPPSLWKRLRLDIDEFITERQAGGKTVLAWYHRQFIETAQKMYLGDPYTNVVRHQLLADMFRGEYSDGAIKPITLHGRKKEFRKADRQAAAQPLMFGDDVFNLRKLQELPYHLMQCTPVDCFPNGLIKYVMYNYEWILAKLRALSFIELVDDFMQYDDESALLIDALYLSGSNIKEDPFALAGQLIGRLTDFVDVYPNIGRLLQEAKSWMQTTTLSLIIPRGACLIPPGGQLKASLAGHPNRVEAIRYACSVGMLVTICNDNDGQPMANVWDEPKIELIHTLEIKAKQKASGKLTLVLSPDEKHVVFGCQVLGVFALSSGSLVCKLETGKNHAISSCTIQEDGCHAVAGAEKGTNVYLWDLRNGQLLMSLNHPAAVHFTFFEGNSEILSVCQDGRIRRWSIDTKDCIHCFEVHRAGDIREATRSAMNKTMITGSYDGTIKISSYLHEEHNSSITLKAHKKAISCLLILSENRLASGSGDSVVYIWDMVTGMAILSFKGHVGMITSLWFGEADQSVADSREILVTGSKDDCLNVWSLNTDHTENSLITSLEGHSSWITDVTGSSSQKIYSASNDKSAKVWDYKRNTVIKRERHKEHAFGLVFGPDKSTVITSGQEGTVKFSRFSDCQVIRQESGFAYTLLISSDGKKLIGGMVDEGVVRVWDVVQSEDRNSSFDLEGHDKDVLCIIQGHDDEIITGSLDTTVKLWSLESKSCLKTLEGHKGSVEIVKVTKQEADTLILSADSKGMLNIWEYKTGECLLSAKEHRTSIRCLSVSDDGKYAVTGGNDKKALLWSLDSSDGSFGKVLQRLAVHTSEVTCAIFMHDGRRIITASHSGSKQLYMWNISGDETDQHFIYGHSHAILDMHISANDCYLVTASRDCTVKAWHLPSRQLMASFDCKSAIKHIDVVYINEDHYRIAGENKTGTILLLDLFLPKADRSEAYYQSQVM
ncbi:NACHT domain- and WD repeat-containing protein 1-like isoform X1 [Lytechinus pictus]|uniref:NACHT domain- and WD repeat-containing protein 1-like isoform X1 n=1 Tax=Lytechinus pictus TaxID=7653 RepID=UPI0030BA291A